MTPHATVGTKGQVVIPVAARNQLGIEPGQTVDVEVRGGQLVLTPFPKDIIAFLGGSLADGPSILDELVREHAEEVRRDAQGDL